MSLKTEDILFISFASITSCYLFGITLKLLNYELSNTIKKSQAKLCINAFLLCISGTCAFYFIYRGIKLV